MQSLNEDQEIETDEDAEEICEIKGKDSFIVRVFGSTIGGILLFVAEIIQIVVIAGLIIVPIRYLVVQPFYVRGSSMEPTFLDGQYLLIDELSYKFHKPHRGDVVVFRYPLDTKEFFIKRIIGLPGDTIDIQDRKIVITNKDNKAGVVLQEDYLRHVVTEGDVHKTLNPDEYFMMGDNRMASMDSRKFGVVKEEYLVGKVWLRGLPLDSFTIFKETSYSGIN